MINPCAACVVRVCCTLICKEKEDYTSELQVELESLGPKLYSRNGNRRKHVRYDIKKRNEKIIKKLNRNLSEIQSIFHRATSGPVEQRSL